MKYLILTTRSANFKQEAIQPHYEFLEQLKQSGHLEMFGPFTDKSGGAYIIKAKNLEEAQQIAFRDPVHTTGSSIVKVMEWDVKLCN